MFYKQLFIDRFFHADPHPGNFFVQRGPEGQARIVVLDLGSATELRKNLADGMFDILQGLMTRKDDLVVRGIDEMGFMAAEWRSRAARADDAQVLREATQPQHPGLLGKIDPAVADQLADPEMKREELRELMKLDRVSRGLVLRRARER